MVELKTKGNKEAKNLHRKSWAFHNLPWYCFEDFGGSEDRYDYKQTDLTKRQTKHLKEYIEKRINE